MLKRDDQVEFCIEISEFCNSVSSEKALESSENTLEWILIKYSASNPFFFYIFLSCTAHMSLNILKQKKYHKNWDKP